MDNIARSVLRDKIKSLKATYFQDGLDKIFLVIYEDRFTRIKQKHDQGSDGIIDNNTIIAAYAPENYSLSDFKKKVGSDYKSYEENWIKTHPCWMVVTNLELLSSMQKYVDGLKSNSKTLCIEGIVELIRKQTWSKINLIFQSLDIPAHYLSNDVVGTVIEDLINVSDNETKIAPYQKPIYIEEKAEINLSDEEYDAFIDEYEEFLQLFSLMKNIIQNQEPKSIQALRTKIRNTFNSTKGEFSSRLNTTCEILASQKYNDDYYMYHMRAVLFYFFEQCLFGKRTSEEKRV
ncbi:hypothetical protein [Endozoicomonas elysicola]|uniref:Uncharacterized protein n=2 Tax=Endozoicomonas elysicola TaxID=305900 RepID=A0A081KB88_9GAMM|nr:hypothetical protein [Endozoicomonas elysicola]KEI71414.1 hypothetical protein GV64_12275 [Endozoicomonas elysicola]